MTHIEGTTKAQTIFLRQCAKDPMGLSGRPLPNPATFRKWLRRPGFRDAMLALRDAMHFQADLHLAAAAATAAQAIAGAVRDESGSAASIEQLKPAKDQITTLASLLRLSHLRQRFADELDDATL